MPKMIALKSFAQSFESDGDDLMLTTSNEQLIGLHFRGVDQNIILRRQVCVGRPEFLHLIPTYISFDDFTGPRHIFIDFFVS